MRRMDGPDMRIEIHLRAIRGHRRRTPGTSKQLALLTMINSEMNLDSDLGVEDLLAKGATVQVVRVSIEEVPLEFVRFPEGLAAGLASVLGRRREEVGEEVLGLVLGG